MNQLCKLVTLFYPAILEIAGISGVGYDKSVRNILGAAIAPADR